METQEKDHAKEQAKCQMESISAMIGQLQALRAADNDEEAENVEQIINEDPLSLLVRDDWYQPGHCEKRKPVEFELLLCTGGPAVRIIGDIDEHGGLVNPRLEYQDWGIPWTEYHDLSEQQEKDLLAYCQCFYYAD